MLTFPWTNTFGAGVCFTENLLLTLLRVEDLGRSSV